MASKCTVMKKVAKGDVIEGLLEMGLLDRLSYIMRVIRIDEYIDPVLDILIR